MICPHCGNEIVIQNLESDLEQELELDYCEVPSCTDIAVYEGWYRIKDALTGRNTGKLQRLSVCSGHAYLLMSGDENV